MEYKQAKSLIAKLARQIKLLSIVVGGLLACNAILGLLLWHQSNRRDIILIPSNLQQKASITQSGVSSSYLEAMAMMLVNDRLNITPENIKLSNQSLLTFVDPGYYAVFKKQLFSDESAIINGKISSSFYANSVHSNTKTMHVTICGQLKRWVGERLIGVESKSYRLTFSRNNDLLLLKSFQELEMQEGRG
jgi:conjugal transfer pilus assembly protein TraE